MEIVASTKSHERNKAGKGMRTARSNQRWPDVDNMQKIVTDALNGVAYLDDKRV